MRVELLQAIGLVAGLHLASGLMAPATLDPGDLAQHPGETVELEGRIATVQPSGEIARVRLDGERGQAWVLARGEVPPLGAHVRVTGDAATGQEGPVLWMTGAWTVLERPSRAPVGVDRLVHQAPDREGQTLSVAGRWDQGASQLSGDQARLAVTLRAAPPPPGATIVVWGVLSYTPQTASYRLDATGWTPWSPSRA